MQASPPRPSSANDCAPCADRSRDAAWSAIMAAFCVYVAVTLIGERMGGGWQALGVALFMVPVSWRAAGVMFPMPLDGLNVSLIVALLVPLCAYVAGLAVPDAPPVYAVKYYALLFLIWMTTALRLPPLYRVRQRWWGLGALLALLLLGGGLAGAGERVEGSFANPNNFALAAMGLLCFVAPEHDTRRFRLAMDALVLFLILRSGTAGALLGYLAGLGMRLSVTRRWWLGGLATLGLCVTLLLPDLVSMPDAATLGGLRLLGPIWTKIEVFREHYAILVSGGDLNFWEIGQAYGGAEMTSAIWRLFHWREVIWLLARSAWPALCLGHGLGASWPLLGQLPHNDYLRLLVEVGILGLGANLAVWLALYRRLAPAVRRVAVMLAVYAFTENNFDNFLAMGLLVLFMAGVRQAAPLTAVGPGWNGGGGRP